MAAATNSGVKMLCAGDRVEIDSLCAQPERSLNDTSRKPRHGRGRRISARRSTYKCRETTRGFPQAGPGNRRLLRGNPKTRSLLRVGNLEAKPAPPAIPVSSIVPLAAVRLIQTLLTYQLASEEFV
jgi:hypothetical protein